MNDNELSILKFLSSSGQKVSASELSGHAGVSYSSLMSALEGLSQKQLVDVERKQKSVIELSAEGAEYAKNGTPERRLARAVKKEKSAELSAATAAAGLSGSQVQVALQWAMRLGWLKAEKKGDRTMLSPAKEAEETDVEKALVSLARGKRVGGAADEKTLAVLKQRGLVRESEEKTVFALITPKGVKALAEEANTVSQLTPSMLKSGEWRGRKFREYDLRTVAAPLAVARKQVYKEFLEKMRLKLVGMGFREVRAPLIELEFWNMDALFMPQDHPARDIHDVFKVKSPREGEIPEEEVFKRVYDAHLHGGPTGSSGWRYEMKRSVSESVILRSHDTGISARTLFYDFRSPDRVFFIAHVFRPDEIDWKHFIEFNQLGGYVTDESMSFSEMLGYLKSFAVEVFGAKEVRFIPSYFPFTEPSVSMNVNIPGKGWAEVGGAGMFRPEMLHALGVRHPVVAWGLGIDRLAMLTLGITDIRELNSHKIDFLRGR